MEKKRKFSVPHVYVLLLALILLCSVLTYIIPAGQYDMTTIGTREVIDSTTYHTVESTPVTLMQLLSAVPRGMQESAQIIFFIFIIGGAFAILQETGAIEAGIGRLIRVLKDKTLIIIPVIMVLFSLGGSTFGMCEEIIPLSQFLYRCAWRWGMTPSPARQSCCAALPPVMQAHS